MSENKNPFLRLRLAFNRLAAPKQSEDKIRRQELILNILLLASIFLLAIINLIRLNDYLRQGQDRGLPLLMTLLILAVFIWLFYLSRRGWIRLSASLLVLIYALPTFYFAYRWGADLPAALLLSGLIIIISGVLLGARFAWLNTILISTILLILTYGQSSGRLPSSQYWRAETNELADMISYVVILGVIATVAWLYAREIEKSLRRARQSEQDLRIERDSLETKVIERTRQIRELEMDKITQLYRLAEFGRLSSGIFHDLINPLTAVGLNLEQLKKTPALQGTNAYLEQAFRATAKMENFIAGIKKQIQGDKAKRYFSLATEIEEIRQILDYKIRKSQVGLKIEITPELELYGNPLKFGQIIANLLSNALDACQESGRENKRIELQAEKKSDKIIIMIADNGGGIAPENQDKIWQAFFSTKTEGESGLGIGLASVKSLTEKDFQGTITFVSSPAGTEFRIELPLEKKAYAKTASENIRAYPSSDKTGARLPAGF